MSTARLGSAPRPAARGTRAMNDLNRKALRKLVPFLIAVAAALFLVAGTLAYWQAWMFAGVFSAATLAITVYLMKNDPGLLERRMSAGPGSEKEMSQKIIQVIALIAFIAVLVFPAIDHRFRWSAVPAYVALAGDVLVGLGLLIVFFVFKENTFASAVIEVGSGQKVIATGPYAFVRHPMYSGGLIMLWGMPLALGSWWGLLTVIPITLVIIWRLLDEENFLAKSLPGYAEYRNRVKYRLLPPVW